MVLTSIPHQLVFQVVKDQLFYVQMETNSGLIVTVCLREIETQLGESVTVANGDNCMTAGPIAINNGVTVTVNNGGSWSIV